MLEMELFALLDKTADAAYTVTPDGTIHSWNHSAELLFGYPAAEVMGPAIDEVLHARDTLGTDALAGGVSAASRRWEWASGGIANFDLEVTARSGERLWINVSTILFDNARTGQRFFIRLARDQTGRHRKELLLSRMQEMARQLVSLTVDVADHSPIEALTERERRILKLFADGSNPAAIVQALKISPQTLRNHLHRINRKLRTHNRLEAVTHAQRRGLID
jgi:PAS domain S-box-containing protein